MNDFLVRLEAAGWLKHISAIIDTSAFIAKVGLLTWSWTFCVIVSFFINSVSPVNCFIHLQCLRQLFSQIHSVPVSCITNPLCPSQLFYKPILSQSVVLQAHFVPATCFINPLWPSQLFYKLCSSQLCNKLILPQPILSYLINLSSQTHCLIYYKQS